MTQPSGRPRKAGSSRTRDRILDAALALFNLSGIASVAINSIAVEVGISPGNLYYHFKTKEEIIDRLVKRYQNRIEAITNTTSSVIALDDIWLVVHLALETIQQYRFVYRDIDYIIHESPGIAQRIQKITVHGVAATRRMCQDLSAASVIRATPEDLDSLALQMVFTATCWGTFASVLSGGNGAADVSGRAAYQVLTLLTPYLSDDAQLYMTYLRSKYVKGAKSC